MIGKTIKGTEFRPLLDYLLSPAKVQNEGARIIASSMAGETPEELAAEFDAIARLRPGLKKKVYHQVLSLRQEEGEALSDEQFTAIARCHATNMGYRHGQWVVIRHGNHIHTVANRILKKKLL